MDSSCLSQSTASHLSLVTCALTICFSLGISTINWKMNLGILAHPPECWDNAGSWKCKRQARSKRQLHTAVRTWAGMPWPLQCRFSRPTLRFQKTLWLPIVRVFLFHLTNTGANLGFIPSLPLNSWINSSYPPTNTRAICQPFIPPTHIWETPLICCSILCSFQNNSPSFPVPAWAKGCAHYSKHPFHSPPYSSGLSQRSHPRMVLSPTFQVQRTIQWSEFVYVSRSDFC